MKTAARIKNSKLFLRAALFILAILLLAPLALTFFYSFFSRANNSFYFYIRSCYF